MNNKKMFFLILLLMLLFSCSIFDPKLKPPALTPSFSPTVVFIPLPLSTPTVVAPMQPVSTADNSEKSNISRICLGIKEDDVLLEKITMGTMVFGDIVTRPSLLDIVAQSHYDLSYQTNSETTDWYIYGFQPSPNRDYLAYMEVVKNASGDPQYFILRVVDSKGNMLDDIVINKNDISPYWRWVNNETIQMISFESIQKSAIDIYKPFEKEKLKIRNESFELYYDADYFWRPAKLVFDYSPDFEWAIYLAKQEDGNGPIVVDLISSKIIWQAVGKGANHERPEWSNTGEYIATISNGRLYIINRNGRTLSPPGLKEDDKILDGQFSWSPDGSYIAFWVNRGIVAHLMLYDVQNGYVLDYCVEDIYQGSSIIWSPDSRQFITSLVREISDSNTERLFLLIDIQENIAYRLSTGQPIAWLNTLP